MCGDKQRPPKREEESAIYPELAIARESAKITCIKILLAGKGEGKRYSGKKGKPAAPRYWHEDGGLAGNGSSYVIG